MNVNLRKARFSTASVAMDISIQGMTLYPNPTTGKFTVGFNSDSQQPLVLKVIETATGKITKTQFVNAAKGNNQIVVENALSSGLYIVTLEGDNVKYNAAKLLVNRK
jgi:hypothetical protein